MADRPPPRNPGGAPTGRTPHPAGQGQPPDRRAQMSNRYRADSTGSTRGAFKLSGGGGHPQQQQQPSQPGHLQQGHGAHGAHGHGHGHGHGGHRGHGHGHGMNDAQVHAWASQGSADAAMAAAITDSLHGSSHHGGSGHGPMGGGGGIRDSLMVGDGMGQMYGSAHGSGGGGYGAMQGDPMDPMRGGPPMQITTGADPYNAQQQGYGEQPFGGYDAYGQPLGGQQQYQSPPKSGKKKKKKKKKKDMTLADVAGMAMADMADPQSEIGLVQSPERRKKNRSGGGHTRGTSGDQMSDAEAAALMNHQPLPTHPLSAGEGQREGSQHGGSHFADLASGQQSRSSRGLGQRSDFGGQYGGMMDEGNSPTREAVPSTADKRGSLGRQNPSIQGDSNDPHSLMYSGSHNHSHAVNGSSYQQQQRGGAGVNRPAPPRRGESGGSGIIGDALLDSLADDIQASTNHGAANPIKPKAMRPPQGQGTQGQGQALQDQTNKDKGTINPPTKLKNAKSGGGANKNLPRPGAAVRVSSFGPGGGHTFNSAQEAAAQVQQHQTQGHHKKGHGHGPKPPKAPPQPANQGEANQGGGAQNEIDAFSSMVLSDDTGYGATASHTGGQAPKSPVRQQDRSKLPEEMQALSPAPSYDKGSPKQSNMGHISMVKGGSVASSGGFDGIEKGVVQEGAPSGLWDRMCDTRFMYMLWGPRDIPYKPCPPDMDPDEYAMYPELDLAALPPLRRGVTFFLFDPLNPELTSTQQFCWACLIGVFFGVMTATWGSIIEYCVDVMWEKVPEMLLEWGWFTDLEGSFPLPHYMWVCPTVCGGLFAYITAILPKAIPDQNEWIASLHKYGVIDSSTFVSILLTATAGMASGLSLGPELPLVLASGMVGSWLGLKLRQSILSARVLNLTAGSAAIGGFFGFPMAGALFVLELPHQMGLQYFEALSPATIASIVAVLVNRMVTGNDIKGYFNYPFLTASLPSHIFYIAILYGVVGAIIGVIYADGVKKLKTWVHDWFHYHEHHDDHGHGAADHGAENGEEGEEHELGENGEKLPLVGKANLIAKVPPPKSPLQKCGDCLKPITGFTIKHEPTRAAVVGTIAGGLTGLICMFLPHNLFWGEAQLQTIIDNGRTPLPVFGEGDEPTAMLTAYGYCMIDPEDERAVAAGFSYQCMGMIAFTKILTIGLSIGTGIIGGHFWGPLYVAAAGSRFFLDLMVMMTERFGFGATLSTYPCVAILCIMGSAHVVTFRAHMAIMLILTLTISAFTPEESMEGGSVGGDYSAVFPLLVVSCFVSLMTTRSHQFYKKQQCRGDIDPKPEVLCEPKKEGMPWLDSHQLYGAEWDSEYDSQGEGSWEEGEEGDEFGEGEDDDSYYDDVPKPDDKAPAAAGAGVETTQEDIEREFMAQQQAMMAPPGADSGGGAFDSFADKKQKSDVTPDTAQPTASPSSSNDPFGLPPSKRLDELLAAPLDAPLGRPTSRTAMGARRNHRRVRSDITGGVISTMPTPLPAPGAGSRARANSSDRRGAHRRSGSIDARGRVRSNSRDGRSTPTGSVGGGGMARISSYGEVVENQPSLMDQARRRASSVNRLPVPPPGAPPRGRHSRQNSNASAAMITASGSNVSGGGGSRGNSPVESAGALSQADLESGFSAALGSAGRSKTNP